MCGRAAIAGVSPGNFARKREFCRTTNAREHRKCTMAYDERIKRVSIYRSWRNGHGIRYRGFSQGNRTEGNAWRKRNGACTTPSRGADCESPARRYSGALLLLAIASLLIACGGGSSPGTTPSSSVTLEWDAVIDPSLVGYRLYYGLAPGRTYLQAPGEGLSVGNVPTYTLTGLSSGTTYYFGVTAYDTANNESGYSNEVSTTVP